MRNKYGITVISSPAELPKELDIEQFIDYDTQFNKAFIEPLNAIAEKINWTTKQITATTLDDFFS
jgi:DNA polymerase elongation subunit (family B)